ncbi:FecR family protein [Cyclobacterium xiamenense]|uniref:FecR family protein n=1 Tax=Cyclobacterium xiamenense TaxID=1297121 RepID=UPI0035CF0A84
MKKEQLIRFLNGTASKAEQKQVLNWLEQEGAREVFDQFLNETWRHSRPDRDDPTDYEALLERIHKTIRPKSTSRNSGSGLSLGKIFRVAASFLLLTGSIFFLREGMQYQKPAPVAIAQTTITKKTGDGEKLTLQMPDGTHITLNANSALSFSSGFGKQDRVVYLQGEAYFSIAKNPRLPFQLHTGEMITTALGTEFNAYARSGRFALALTEGRVAVDAAKKRVELEPGQMATLHTEREPDALDVRPFDIDRTVGWKEGQLVLDRKPLKALLADLSSWYDVEMKIDPRLDLNARVIGTFRNKNLADVLTGLGFSMGFDFEINDKMVVIKKESL